MSQSEHDRRIDYIEFPVSDVAVAKRFYSAVFGWEFTDYGPDYTSFVDGRLSGGFRGGEAARPGNALIVIYATDLEGVASAVQAAGGHITQPTFDFPGGRRFHFRDPSGHELAVWSDPIT
ncbi:MAG: VOC family protein [Gemmatimonadales bacterium]|nr:VOC family protein [Gemmatimonadales bacterium]